MSNFEQYSMHSVSIGDDNYISYLYCFENKDDYYTLQETIDALNNENEEFIIEQNDLFHCAALNMIPLQIHTKADLKLIDSRNPENVIEYYAYAGPLEILDYKLGSERGFGNFDTYKVKPLDFLRCEPDRSFGTNPPVPPTEAHQFAPYDYYCYWYTNEQRNALGDVRIHNGLTVDISDIEFKKCYLPTLKNALLNLKLKIAEKHKTTGRYTIEEAAKYISIQTEEHEVTIQNTLVSAIKAGNLDRYAPDSEVKYTNDKIRVYYEEVFWNDLNSWLKINEPRLSCVFPDGKRTPVTAKKHIYKGAFNQGVILDFLIKNGYKPPILPDEPSGKAGVKAFCRQALCIPPKSNQTAQMSTDAFDAAWEMLRKDKKIQGAKKTPKK